MIELTVNGRTHVHRGEGGLCGMYQYICAATRRICG